MEGSTELWEWSPETMNLALAMHDAFLRAAMATCNGYEVCTEGDAFLVAFCSPADAARWCCAVQEALCHLIDW